MCFFSLHHAAPVLSRNALTNASLLEASSEQLSLLANAIVATAAKFLSDSARPDFAAARDVVRSTVSASAFAIAWLPSAKKGGAVSSVRVGVARHVQMCLFCVQQIVQHIHVLEVWLATAAVTSADSSPLEHVGLVATAVLRQSSVALGTNPDNTVMTAESCPQTLPEPEEPPLRYLDTDSATTHIPADTEPVARRTTSLVSKLNTFDKFWRDKFHGGVSAQGKFETNLACGPKFSCLSQSGVRGPPNEHSPTRWWSMPKVSG